MTFEGSLFDEIGLLLVGGIEPDWAGYKRLQVRDVVRLGGIAHWRLPEPTRNKFVNEATAFGNLPRYQQVWLSLLGRAPKLGPVKTYVVVGGGVYRNGVLSHMLGMIQSRLLQEGDELSLSGFLIPPTGNPA